MEFVSLHTHTTFSTGDGYGMPAVHIKRAKDLGYKAIGFSEHGNVSSWIELEKGCEKHGMEPIFGIEIYVGLPKVQSKTHMILIAMNLVGLQNINRIVTQSWKQFYYSPTVYWEDLVRWNEGIIALSGCSGSALSCVLLGGKYFGEQTLELSERNYERAVRGVRRFQKIFGDRYYLEVQRFPGLDRTCVLNPALAQISRDTGIPLAATADVHYPYPDQNVMQRILHAASRGKDVETADAEFEYSILLTYPQSDAEILKDLEDTGLSDLSCMVAVGNTAEIAKRCRGTRLPKAKTPRFVLNGKPVGSPKTLLQVAITAGWKYRISYNEHMKSNVKAYKERMHYEFQTICAREGFADYFLIVADLVQWAKGKGIAVGPGRGSSVGSLICYLLRITEIDSMQFPVLFERFLDPTRTDPPDIDVDFETDRRDEVFVYAASKYGSDRVGNILNFTRYLGRNSLDDIGRVYRIPDWKIQAIKDKLIERMEGHPRFSKSLQDTIDTFPEVQEFVAQTPGLAYATRLEGNIKNFNVHAAGMVITTVPINEICAVYEREIEGVVRQAIPYTKHDIPYLNLLKIDALSLITMSEIAEICRDAGITLEELYRIPLNDEKTLQAFRDGDVLGIFQFEGVATRRVLRAVKPTKFQHLSDVNALVRPGANDKQYVAHKNSGKWDKAVHPIIDGHLDWTYGTITYEEQILMILRDLGGFEPTELNRMRKIIHDKLGGTAFNEYYQRFVKGCAAHNISEDIAKSVWEGMVNASGYAFNIAHSVSYSHIGYWHEWLKVHYPAPFYRAKVSKISSSSSKDKATKLAKMVAEAERKGIMVRPPSLLESGLDWTLVEDYSGVFSIVAGLMAVPTIGIANAQKIIEWREAKTEEEGLDDFYPEWEDLLEIKGFGPKKVATLRAFAENDDPFGIHKTKRTLDAVRDHFSRGQFTGIPSPTHVSIDIPKDRQLITFVGIVRKKKYYDAVERLQKRSTDELEYDEALAQLEDNHLVKYCNLTVEDEHNEPVTVAISRWVYPKYARQLQELKVNSDVVVAQGFSSDFGGIRVQVKSLTVLNPHQ